MFYCVLYVFPFLCQASSFSCCCFILRVLSFSCFLFVDLVCAVSHCFFVFFRWSIYFLIYCCSSFLDIIDSLLFSHLISTVLRIVREVVMIVVHELCLMQHFGRARYNVCVITHCDSCEQIELEWSVAHAGEESRIGALCFSCLSG